MFAMNVARATPAIRPRAVRPGAARLALSAVLLAACGGMNGGEGPAVGLPGVAEDASVPAGGEWVVEAGGLVSRSPGIPLSGSTDFVARRGMGGGLEVRATASGDDFGRWPQVADVDAKLVLGAGGPGGAPGAAVLAGVSVPLEPGAPTLKAATALVWMPNVRSGLVVNAACGWIPGQRPRQGTCAGTASAGYAVTSFVGGFVQYTGEAAPGGGTHAVAAGVSGLLPGGFSVHAFTEQASAGNLAFGARIARTLGAAPRP